MTATINDTSKRVFNSELAWVVTNRFIRLVKILSCSVPVPLKNCETELANSATPALGEARKKPAKMAGNCKMALAKINGIMPERFTISGRVPRTGMDMRLPMRRPGYITGTFRRPSVT